ncbi:MULTISPECIES: hypothetical protein [Exiguobacterium]|uniref:hypothetical protein n=1 Tax=Exiguobacterium TaxID=33986 RepID=UPI001AE922A1|nr:MULTISPECIES: hypothetical protein [Exiguobacterium]MCT4779821.1 hypothetical protein [Exiguobacterium soli]
MSDKRYTVIFDAKDKISSILDRFIRKSKESEDALKRTSRETENFGQSSSNQAKRVEGAYNSLHGRLKVVDGAFLRMDDSAKRSNFALREMGGTPLSRLSDGLSGITTLLGGISVAAIGAGTAISAMAVKGTFDNVLMPAMKREADTVTVGATLKDESMLPSIMKDIEAQAQDSVFGVSEILTGTKGMLGLTQDRGMLKDVNNLTERIALTDPEQGYKGASYAMKQAMSGDLNSIVDRFELDRASFYKEGYKAGLSPEEYYQIVEKVISDKGFDQDFLEKSRNTGIAQYENAKSNIQELGVKAGFGMVEELKPYLKMLNGMFKQKDEMKKFTDSMSDRFQSVLKRVFALGDGVQVTWADITKWSENTFDGVINIIDSTATTFGTLMTVLSGGDLSKPQDSFKNFGDVLDGVAGFIDKINDGLIAIGQSMEFLKPLDEWWSNAQESGLASALGLNADKENKSSNEQYGLIGGPVNDTLEAWQGVDWGNLKPDWNPVTKFKENTKKTDDIPLFGDNLLGHAVKDGADATWSGIKSGANAVAGWFGGQADGSHANGLSYVPKDDYKANLHKGERVLTRAENRDYSQLMQSGTQEASNGVVINVTTMNVRSNEDIDAIGESIVMRLQARG